MRLLEKKLSHSLLLGPFPSPLKGRPSLGPGARLQPTLVWMPEPLPWITWGEAALH